METTAPTNPICASLGKFLYPMLFPALVSIYILIFGPNSNSPNYNGLEIGIAWMAITFDVVLFLWMVSFTVFSPFQYSYVSLKNNHFLPPSDASSLHLQWLEVAKPLDKELAYLQENLQIIWMHRRRGFWHFNGGPNAKNFSCFGPTEHCIWFDGYSEIKTSSEADKLVHHRQTLAHEIAHAIDFKKVSLDEKWEFASRLKEEAFADSWGLLSGCQGLSDEAFQFYGKQLAQFRKNTFLGGTHRTTKTLHALFNLPTLTTLRCDWENWEVDERYQWLHAFVVNHPPK